MCVITKETKVAAIKLIANVADKLRGVKLFTSFILIMCQRVYESVLKKIFTIEISVVIL
mgnify:FL=1